VILNVTQREFKEIQEANLNLPEYDFIVYMCLHYGCEMFQKYEIRVRKDVVAIPWLTKNVFRIER